MTHSRFTSVLVLAALFLAPFAGAGELSLFVASRSYNVAVAPVDEESKNADEAVLYTRRAPGGEWESLGPCRRVTLPNGGIRFTRDVEVPHDGVFQYTSRPVVGGEVENPPKPADPAQAVVTVDTIPPTVEILNPVEGIAVAPGESISLSWVISDEHLDAASITLSFSTDSGRGWSVAERGLSAEGNTAWSAPADLDGPALLRLSASDRAGNTGRGLRRFALGKAATPEGGDRVADAPSPEREREKEVRDPNRSWLYYLMAVNLMRQNKPADALQYYWLSVREDPDFINAWADIALAYIDLGAYKTAREVVGQTREKAPERIDLLHLMGETYHAEGMARLGEARDAEERMQAKGLIDQAVAWYGRALDKASEEWRLAEQAASFYRLGEVCYYVNMDREGARAYWKKILELHSPTPNSDLILWSEKGNKAKERRRQEKYIYQRVALDTWQGWARGYLEQMDRRERAGILDLMPAQRVASYGCDAGPAPSLPYSGNDINPGRDDGRSLFSLPADLGSPDDISACVGVSGASPGYNGYDAGGESIATRINRPPVTEGYSFYAPETWGRRREEERRAAPTGRRSRSMFSNQPEPPAAIPDPYDFPRAGRSAPAWNQAQPYGNAPVSDW